MLTETNREVRHQVCITTRRKGDLLLVAAEDDPNAGTPTSRARRGRRGHDFRLRIYSRDLWALGFRQGHFGTFRLVLRLWTGARLARLARGRSTAAIQPSRGPSAIGTERAFQRQRMGLPPWRVLRLATLSVVAQLGIANVVCVTGQTNALGAACHVRSLICSLPAIRPWLSQPTCASSPCFAPWWHRSRLNRARKNRTIQKVLDRSARSLLR
jgi:hypothetical protein